MQLRVVTDQPWDVKADVLAIPVTARARLRRARSASSIGAAAASSRAQAAFGELNGDAVRDRGRRGRRPAAPDACSRSGPGPLGEPGPRDGRPPWRDHRAPPRRSSGAHASRSGSATSPLPSTAARRRSPSCSPAASSRGASIRPRIYRAALGGVPARARRADPRRPGSRRRGARRGRRARRHHRRGVEPRPGRLANRAANDVSPEALAGQAGRGCCHGLSIDCTPSRRPNGHGRSTAVGRGSAAPPPDHRPCAPARRGEKGCQGLHLALVGKGVGFDSGGIAIEPAQGMEDMKTTRRAGAPSITASPPSPAAPDTPLLAVAPAAENMPGNSARPPRRHRARPQRQDYRVINTDAEGRLVLANALSYPNSWVPTHLVEVARPLEPWLGARPTIVTGAFGDPRRAGTTRSSRPGRGRASGTGTCPGRRRPPGHGELVRRHHPTSGTLVEASLVKSGLFLRQFVDASRGSPGHRIHGGLLPQDDAVGSPGDWAPAHATHVELALAGAALAGVEQPVLVARPGHRRGRVGTRRRPDRRPAGRPTRTRSTRRARSSGRAAGSGRSTGGRSSSSSSAARRSVPLGAPVRGPGPARDLRGLLRGPDAAPRHGPGPAAAARRHHPARDPDRPRDRRSRRANPLVPPEALPGAILAAVAIPAVLFAVAIPFGAGAIGMGDLKLLVSVGLLAGLARAVTGVVVGALVARRRARGPPRWRAGSRSGPTSRSGRSSSSGRTGQSWSPSDPVVRVVGPSRRGVECAASRVVPRRAPSDGDAPAGRTPPWRVLAPNGAPLAR